jgi:hypothetical protein
MVARQHYPTARNGNPVVTPEVSPRACMRFDSFLLEQVGQQDQALRDASSELRALSRRLLNKAPRVA